MSHLVCLIVSHNNKLLPPNVKKLICRLDHINNIIYISSLYISSLFPEVYLWANSFNMIVFCCFFNYKIKIDLQKISTVMWDQITKSALRKNFKTCIYTHHIMFLALWWWNKFSFQDANSCCVLQSPFLYFLS